MAQMKQLRNEKRAKIIMIQLQPKVSVVVPGEFNTHMCTKTSTYGIYSICSAINETLDNKTQFVNLVLLMKIISMARNEKQEAQTTSVTTEKEDFLYLGLFCQQLNMTEPSL